MTDCACGEGSGCLNAQCGYPWCRSCGEHHRAPECAIDQDGHALAPCGCRWSSVEEGQHSATTCVYEGTLPYAPTRAAAPVDVLGLQR